MDLTYEKFKNGDKIIFKPEPNEVFYYVGLNPLNPKETFLMGKNNKTNEDDIVIVLTQILEINYELL